MLYSCSPLFRRAHGQKLAVSPVDANEPTLIFKGIAIEAGKSTEKVEEFFGGALKVKALRNDKPFRAYCVIYKVVEDEEKEKEKVAESLTEIEGTAFNLPIGAYDVIVENKEDPDRPTVVFRESQSKLEKTSIRWWSFREGP